MHPLSLTIRMVTFSESTLGVVVVVLVVVVVVMLHRKKGHRLFYWCLCHTL